MNATENLATHPITIPAANLPRCLKRAATLATYPYDDWDADAIAMGLRDSSTAGFDYTFHADTDARSIAFHFGTQADSSDVSITFQTVPKSAESLLAFGELMHDFAPDVEYFGLLGQIDTTFPQTAPTGDNPFAVVDCSPEHLAICEEHQEALAFFQKPDWKDLLQNDGAIPTGYATITFLTDNAARFAFPAYLASTLRYRNFDILQIAIDRTDTDWLSPKGHELVGLARQLAAESRQ